MSDLLLTFYGDDFTGSTDVMETLTFGGVPCVLFLEPPARDFIDKRFPHARAVGVAGISRSLSPARMDAELPGQFEALKALDAPLFHYKICSTFDSAPTVGSIGHAIEIGWRIFNPSVVPMVVGAPALRRYVSFGNLYAAFGDQVYRLDRHPTMSKHPITPMDESDLRLHLGKQTARRVGLIDLLTLAGDDEQIAAKLKTLTDAGNEIILFDTLEAAHLPKIGRTVWALRDQGGTFSAASSGLEYALVAHWQAAGLVTQPPPPVSPGAVDQLLVVSGSAAPQTAAQIAWAKANGFYAVRLNSTRLIDPQAADHERESVIAAALSGLSLGKSVLLYSAEGPDDPAIARTNSRMIELELDPTTVGSRLGAQQGQILKALVERTALKRVCVVGGDTCGHAMRQLGIYALEVVIPVAPGSPLCKAHAHQRRFDGLEISLKAGQVGKPDYFGSILRGGA